MLKYYYEEYRRQDAKEISFFIELIKSEMKIGKTIIIITHNIEFAMEYISRTILMADGKIIADGPTKKVITNEFLVKKSALILPQISQFNIALNDIGIPCPNNIYSKNKMTEFLAGYIKNKSKIVSGEGN